MAGADEAAAKVNDVRLGAAARGVNPLEIQGQPHGFDLPEKGRDDCKPRPSSSIIRIPAGPDWNVFGGLSPQTPLDRSNPCS